MTDKRLEAIKKNRRCKMLPVNATPEELKNAHLVKMATKKILRERMHAQMAGRQYVPANLGVNHPDYGASMKEHLEEKAKRAQQES